MVEATQTEEPIPSPEAEFVIDTIETLRALSDPLRLRIIELLAAPATVKEIAPKLGIGKTKLYYHLNLLEKHGIIRVVRTRVVSGINEKTYQVTALRFRPAKELLTSGEEGREQGIAIIDSIFDATRSEIAHGLRTKQIELGAPAGLERLLLGRAIMRLSTEQAATFYGRLDALIAEVQQYEVAPEADGRPYTLTLAFFPKAENGR